MRRLVTVPHLSNDLDSGRVQVDRFPHSQALEEFPASWTLGNLLQLREQES